MRRTVSTEIDDREDKLSIATLPHQHASSSQTDKVVPLPGSLSTEILPPCRATSI